MVSLSIIAVACLLGFELELASCNCDVLRNACQKPGNVLNGPCRRTMETLNANYGAHCKSFADICRNYNYHNHDICKNVLESHRHEQVQQRGSQTSFFLPFIKDYVQFFGARTITMLVTKPDFKSSAISLYCVLHYIFLI